MSAIASAPNEVRRFIVENQPVRGYWVDLESAWQDLRAHQDYPPAVRDLLGEAVSAAVLLAATLKFQGTLTLQLEGRGQVRLLVAQCTHDFRVRAVARMRDEDDSEDDELDDGSGDEHSDREQSGERPAGQQSAGQESGGRGFGDQKAGDRKSGGQGAGGQGSGGEASAQDLGSEQWDGKPSSYDGLGRSPAGPFLDLGIGAAGADPFAGISKAARAASAAAFRQLVGEHGRVLVTIEASERDMRYQGIVPLSGDSLSECLEEYFASSEQLPTRVRLAADGRRTVGLLVQKLPERSGEEPEQESAAAIAWREAERGIESVQPAELVGTSLQSVLASRFGQQDVRVFKGSAVQFSCRCSQARVAGVLKTLGAEEVRDVLREQGAVEVTCEFCQRPYRFDALAVEQLFAADEATGGSIH
jgi:redox-regulated HSP33 family molecular chaperone